MFVVLCRAEGASESIIYKIEVPANRYDLLCVEGLTMGLMIFQQKIAAPVYRRVVPDNLLELRVRPATADVRPFVVAAVLRDVTLTQERYQSFIDLQVMTVLTGGHIRNLFPFGFISVFYCGTDTVKCHMQCEDFSLLLITEEGLAKQLCKHIGCFIPVRHVDLMLGTS